MTSNLEALARRVEDDPFFLACALRLYARTEGLSKPQLAQALGCGEDALAMLRLCKTPAGEPADFHRGIEQISTRFHVDADVLAQVVRRGQSIIHLRRGQSAQGTLAAARDADEKQGGNRRHGGES